MWMGLSVPFKAWPIPVDADATADERQHLL